MPSPPPPPPPPPRTRTRTRSSKADSQFPPVSQTRSLRLRPHYPQSHHLRRRERQIHHRTYSPQRPAPIQSNPIHSILHQRKQTDTNFKTQTDDPLHNRRRSRRPPILPHQIRKLLPLPLLLHNISSRDIRGAKESHGNQRQRLDC